MSSPAISEAQADFSLNLLRQLSANNGGASTILSPVSVAVALAMVYAGAKDKTAEQMAQLLANGAPEKQIHNYFGALVQKMQTGSEHYALEVANKVYVKNGVTILAPFRKAIDTHYGGQFEAVSFAKETANQINDFVAKATHDKIRDLITPNMLNSQTRLVLVNAIYFKGTWADQFEAHRTNKGPFHVAEGVQKELDMMHNKKRFIYDEGQNIQLLGMPYVGNEMLMFIVLPKNKFGLADVLAELTGAALLGLLQKRDGKREVEITLPKFKLESTHDLKGPLIELGIPDAFSGANFGGIAKEQLMIDRVLQKAFIEVNEEGTEAAAATAVLMSKGVPRPGRLQFVADHPFACFLVSKEADVLFSGIFCG